MLRSSVLLGAFAVLIAPHAEAQLARGLLREGDAPTGAPAGHTVQSLTSPAATHGIGFGVGVNTSDGVTTLSHFWGTPNAAAPLILRTEATIGNLEQVSFETFWGLSDSGSCSYSPSCNDLVGGGTGLDSAWLDDTVVALEGQPIPSLPGKEWRFASRPGTTAGGIPYWVGGIDDIATGADNGRGLFFGFGATPLVKSGDVLPNMGGPVDPSGISFDYRFSASGTHWIAEIDTTESTAIDNYMVLDGAVLTAGGPADFIREGSPIPLSIGGLAGEAWDNFDYAGVTESGDWFFTGDSDGATTTDEIIVINGVIVHREGDTLDGEVLTGSIDSAYMNEKGRYAFVWDVVDGGGSLEALYVGTELILKQGDEVDLDGDGAVDPGAVLVNLSDVVINGDDRVYFVASVDVNGTSSTTDDIETLFRVECQPVPYGIGKLNSLGQRSYLSYSGQPSLTANNFLLEVSNLVPTQPGIGIWSLNEGNSPFFGHILYLSSPINRINPGVLSALDGTCSVPIPIDASMVGETRYYQFWHRDPTHPDGTGAEVSSALRVEFCP